MDKIINYIPDCLYDSDNDFEIPSLRLDRQPSMCEIPFVCYGEQARTFQMNGHGVLHFYTDDYKFNTIYDRPQMVLQHNPASIVEPNFSMFNEMPIAFAMQAIYKKRWIARTMQERGISVFVDLNVASKYYKLNLVGVPVGYHAFCTRGYSDRLHYLEYEYMLARQVAADNVDKLVFVIYGGGSECRQFAKEHGCIYVNPIIVKKNRLKADIRKIDQTVAFFNEEFSPTKAIEDATANIRLTQIESYVKQLKE